jgi:ribA/ribD-fused uncharacterized protein
MAIRRFTKQYVFLSNFYKMPEPRLEYEGLVYPTVEHAFQAAKTHDPLDRAMIRNASFARDAKKLGRHVPLRLDWETVKQDIMLQLLRIKFDPKTFPTLAQRLTDTAPQQLVEGNTWGDTEWGVDLRTSKGENHLGKLLMQVRDELLA